MSGKSSSHVQPFAGWECRRLDGAKRDDDAMPDPAPVSSARRTADLLLLLDLDANDCPILHWRFDPPSGQCLARWEKDREIPELKSLPMVFIGRRRESLSAGR
jgi:hypothetical protein